jgi:hypothetical protein
MVDLSFVTGAIQIILAAVLVGIGWRLISLAHEAKLEPNGLMRVRRGSRSVRGEDQAPETPLVLPAEVVEGMVQRMNREHADALLAFVQRLADLPWTQTAELTRIDAHGLDLVARAGERETVARILFAAPLVHADQLGPCMVGLARQAQYQGAL